MCEILFRGKRTDNGEWVFGYYCRAFRWTGDKNPVASIQELDCFYFREVDEKTVGQYTGKKDKNGEKIFDGDILEIPNIGNGGTVAAVVYYDCVESAYIVKYEETITTELNGFYSKEIEKIGNIYDNSVPTEM